MNPSEGKTEPELQLKLTFSQVRDLKNKLNNPQTYKFDTVHLQEDYEFTEGKGVNRENVKVNIDLLDTLLDTYIKDAVQKSLRWNESTTKEINALFSKTAVLAENHACQIGDLSFFMERVASWHFQILITTPAKHTIGTVLYDSVNEMFTNLMKTFYALYWRKPLEYKPVFKSRVCEFQDPFYRQTIRKLNLADPEIDKLFFTEDFNIKEFILICLKKFLPHEASYWAKDCHLAHFYTMQIFLETFEFGFWTNNEIDNLNEILHSLVLSMSVLEKFISKQYLESPKLFTEKSKENYLKTFIKIKKILGEIYVHMILIMLDAHVVGALFDLQIKAPQDWGPKNTLSFIEEVSCDKLFLYKKLKCKLFYTYMGYSISTYFLKTTGIGKLVSRSKSLVAVQKKLLGFLTCISIDFYFNSLQTMHPHNFAFYLVNPENEFTNKANEMALKFKKIIKKMDVLEIKAGEPELINELEIIFKGIIEFFQRIHSGADITAAHQVAYSLANISRYLLFMIHYLIEYDFQNKNTKRLARLGAHALAELVHKNPIAISMMIEGVSFVHLKRYSEFDKIGGAMLFSKIVFSDFGILMSEMNEKFWTFFSNQYQLLSNTIAIGLTYSPAKLMGTVTLKDTLAFMAYNKVFLNLFKYKKTHGLRLGILFTSLVTNNSLKFVQFFVQRNIREDTENFERTLEKSLAKIKTWDDLSIPLQEYTLETALHQALSTFRHAVKNFHNENIQTKFFAFFNDVGKINNFLSLSTTNRGLDIFKCIVKIFKVFMVFNRNTTFNFKTFPQNHHGVQTGAYFSEQDLKFEVLDSMKVIFEAIKTRTEYKVGKNEELLLMDVYLPMCWKFLAGFITLAKDKILEEIESSYIKKVTDFFESQKEYIDKLLSVEDIKNRNVPQNATFILFIEALENNSHTFLTKSTPKKKIERLKSICKETMIAILKLGLKIPSKCTEIESIIKSVYKKNPEELFKEMTEQLEFHAKFRLKNDLADVPLMIWQDVPKEFKDSPESNSEGQFKVRASKDKAFESVWVFSYLQINGPGNSSEQIIANRLICKQDRLDCKHAIFYLKNRYKRYKGFLADNFKKNKILYVINIQDAHTQNVQNIVDFFFAKFSEMDISFENPINNFFVDNYYLHLLLFLDNMMQQASLFREKIFEFANDTRNEKIVDDTFHKLWIMNKSLFSHLIYKSFVDTNWSALFKPFYMISNFTQNLCEDNFVEFKRWFSETQKNKEYAISPLEELHFYIEDALLSNEVYASTENELSIPDREEIFPILCRAIECLTEFINGGSCVGASQLYFKRMDIFVGIFFRVIDDLDSEFYSLKDNVIVFVSALIERPDIEIIEFVARNFSVTRIFNLIKTLIKKLYIKHALINKDIKGSQFALVDENTPITSEMENSNYIPNCEILVEYYKVHDDSFSEHQLIDVCIKLYVFMHNIGKHVSRYGHFVDELDQVAKKFKSLKYDSNVVLLQKESAIVWKFLNNITVEMEIEIEDEPQEGKKKKEGEKGRLETYIFQKKSVSFFLPDLLIDDFMRETKISSLEEKHSDFYNIFDKYDEILMHLRNTYRTNRFLYYSNNEAALRIKRFILFAVSCILNLLLLIYYNNITSDFRRHGLGNGRPIIAGFTLFGVIFAGLVLIQWMFANYQFNCKVALSEYRKQQFKKSDLSLYQLFDVYVLDGMVYNIDFVYYALKILFYLLGYFVSPFFYSMSLFLIIELSEIIKGVTLSFIKNWSKLGIGLLLIMMCINFFAYIISDQFSAYFDLYPSNTYMCDSFFKCFLNVMNLGMINDTGIAGVMRHVSLPTNPHFVGRFFLDVIYFIFISILLFEIIFGMIVDSYEEFKEEERKREYDGKNVCFTCGLNKEAIEKNNLRFDDHIKFHKIWKYFFYYQFLKRFPVNDYNGIDIYVSGLIEKQQLSWLPHRRTIQIEALEEFTKFKGN